MEDEFEEEACSLRERSRRGGEDNERGERKLTAREMRFRVLLETSKTDASDEALGLKRKSYKSQLKVGK